MNYNSFCMIIISMFLVRISLTDELANAGTSSSRVQITTSCALGHSGV